MLQNHNLDTVTILYLIHSIIFDENFLSDVHFSGQKYNYYPSCWSIQSCKMCSHATNNRPGHPSLDITREKLTSVRKSPPTT